MGDMLIKAGDSHVPGRDGRRLQPLQAPARREDRLSGRGDDQRLKTACNQFEALFIHFLLKEMRSTIEKSDFMNGGRAEELYESMLDEELAKEISEQKGIGLGSVLYRQLADRPTPAAHLPGGQHPVAGGGTIGGTDKVLKNKADNLKGRTR